MHQAELKPIAESNGRTPDSTNLSVCSDIYTHRRPTRRSSRRASRPEIGAILERAFVPSVILIQTARS